MAFVHRESQDCTKSELDLFTIPATQTSITKGQWIEYQPLRNVTDSGPIEFNVSGSGEEYLDLAKTLLFLKAKITKANGTRTERASGTGESFSTRPVFTSGCFFERAAYFPVD